MVKSRLWTASIGAVLAGMALASSVVAAPPVCGRKACSEEIQACVDSECEGLSGSAHARCRRDCVDAVQSACDQDPSVCNPEMSTTTTEAPSTTTEAPTTSTEATTSSTSTTVVGSPSGVFVE